MKINHLSNLTVHSGSQFHEPLYKQLKQVCAICVDQKLIADKTWNLITLVKKNGKFQFPGLGTHQLSKCPRVGKEEEGKCPTPRIITYQHRKDFKAELFYFFLFCFERFTSG